MHVPRPTMPLDHSDEQAKKLLDVARIVLMQAVDLLDTHLFSDDELTVCSKFLPGSTIGKHLRHARDHFVLLADCVTASGSSPPTLSYDTRVRNTSMETCRESARQAILATVKQLDEVMPKIAFDAPIKLLAVTPHMHSFETTAGRELWFVILHCIHHWSMVRVICGELNKTLSDDFGYAPSTLVYQEREAPLGKAKF